MTSIIHWTRNAWAGHTGARLGMLALGALLLGACGDDGISAAFDASIKDASPTTDAAKQDAGTGTSDAGERGEVDADSADGGPDMCRAESTLGNLCRSDNDCNDLCFCNGQEVCAGSECIAGDPPCDDGFACTVDNCDPKFQECSHEPDHSVCDDGNPCNGAEQCDPEYGCIEGVPMNCSDGDSCTIDSCHPEEGCINQLRDLDGDGFGDGRCEGGTDCNDDPLSGSTTNPEADEICDDGLDNDCDGKADIFDTEDCTPTNDTCSAPTVLSGAGLYRFSTNGLAGDYALDCESEDGPDAVFRFTLEEEKKVRAVVPDSPYESVIEIREWAACAEASGTVACDEDTSSFSSGENADVEVTSLAPGDYAIVVQTPTEGIHSLRLELGATSSHDVCGPATEDATGGGTFAGAYGDVGDDYSSASCGGSGADAAYRLSLVSPKDVEILGSASSSSGFSRDVAISLVSDCDDVSGTEVACAAGTGPVIQKQPLPAGDYFILVEDDESAFFRAETYQIDVSLSAPTVRVMGDTCEKAIDITSSAGSVNIADLKNDGGFSCGGASSPWKEAFFTFELTEESDVTIEADAGGVHLLSVHDTCGDTATERVCRSGTPASTETLNALPAGTYTVGVSSGRGSGTIDVSVDITPTS